MHVAFGRVRRDARRIWASTPQKSHYYKPALKFKLDEALIISLTANSH